MSVSGVLFFNDCSHSMLLFVTSFRIIFQFAHFDHFSALLDLRWSLTAVRFWYLQRVLHSWLLISSTNMPVKHGGYGESIKGLCWHGEVESRLNMYTVCVWLIVQVNLLNR